MLQLHTFIGLFLLCIIAFPYIHIGLLLLLTFLVDLFYDQLYFINRLLTLIVELIMEIVIHPFFIIMAAIYFYIWLNDNDIL